MPAVHTFAQFATVAILFDFIFQITAFVALLSLDQERYEVKHTMKINLQNFSSFFLYRSIGMTYFVALKFKNRPDDMKLGYSRGCGRMSIRQI